MNEKLDMFGNIIEIDSFVLYRGDSRLTSRPRIAKVTKITSKQVYIDDGCYGGWRYPETLQVMDSNMINAFKKRQKINKLDYG